MSEPLQEPVSGPPPGRDPDSRVFLPDALLGERAKGLDTGLAAKVREQVAWLRSVGRHARASKIEKCLGERFLRVGGCACGGLAVTQTGGCSHRSCLVCHQRYWRGKAAKARDAFGVQPFLHYWTVTLPDRPWEWLGEPDLSRVRGGGEWDGEANEGQGLPPGLVGPGLRPIRRPRRPLGTSRSREDYQADRLAYWAARIGLAVESFTPGLVPAVYISLHSRGSVRGKLHCHLNVVVSGLALGPDGMMELPDGLTAPELERRKRVLCQAVDLPWDLRGAGPHLEHRREQAEQDHTWRYAIRHPAEGVLGQLDPVLAFADLPDGAHVLRPAGAIRAGRGAAADQRARWIALRTPIPPREACPEVCRACHKEQPAGRPAVEVRGGVVVAVEVGGVRIVPPAAGGGEWPTAPPREARPAFGSAEWWVRSWDRKFDALAEARHAGRQARGDLSRAAARRKAW